jgi:hypothetical protein
MESRKIALKEFIIRLENTGNEILKNCIKRNTQFSTKFIVQKILAQNEKQFKILSRDPNLTEKPLLPKQWITRQNWNAIQEELKKNFDLENLNFIEANHLAVRLNEYMIEIYRSIQVKTSSTAAKKVFKAMIAQKIQTNLKLKKEYRRLSAES